MKSESNVKKRLLSVDAIRGFDMVWILGAEGLFSALFTLSGFTLFQSLSNQFQHSEWHGFTFYDLIFPLFIFISGVTLGIANKSLIDTPWSVRKKIYAKAFVRLLLLCFFGLLYNHGWGQGIPAEPENIRYASVLMRIGLAWFFSALIVWHFQLRTQIIIGSLILVGYWVLLSFVPTPKGEIGLLTLDHSWNSWVDQHLLPGITYRNLATDPEGLLSHIPAIVNGLAGVWAGRILTQISWSQMIRLTRLVIASLVCLIVGYLWGLFFPVNKTLWTSSFVLVTVGWSGLLLALFYWTIDLLNWRKVGLAFGVIGSNAILLYLLSSLFNWQYFVSSLAGGFIQASLTSMQPLLSVSLLVSIQWLVAYYLYQRKIFFKI